MLPDLCSVGDLVFFKINLPNLPNWPNLAKRFTFYTKYIKQSSKCSKFIFQTFHNEIKFLNLNFDIFKGFLILQNLAN